MKTELNSSVIPIDKKTQQHVTFLGIGIGVIWLLVSVIYRLSGQSFLKFALGSPESHLLVQLFTYSFVHKLGIHLIGNLVVLYVIVQHAKISLSPLGFIRLYSLGSIGGGVIYILMNLAMKRTVPLIGGAIAINACLGALVVIVPRQLRSRLIWFTVFWAVLCVQTATLNISMWAGFIFGILYALIEKMWVRFNLGE